ncbi:MAG: twin-arginine translocase TatA/TatE family subunit [Chloroflexi bacterium]|nr:twin-arginine translocase TatA/TatE family subunit [Chloroflexota bacterium]
MFRPEPFDIVIIVLIAFLIFGGASRIPETVRGIGKSVREFRLAMAGKESELKAADAKTDSTETPKSSS